MSGDEKNKLIMYETVITFLLENKDIISVNRSFAYTISKLRKTIDEIKLRDRELSSNTLEKTIITNKLKDELVASLMPVTNSLFNYARETGNIGLKEKMRLPQSYLVRLRDNELLNKSIAVYSYINSNSLCLNKYGLSKSLLKELYTRINKFKDALDNKILSFVSSNEALSLNNAFLEADKILINQLDRLMEPFNDEYEEFYDDYLSIRAMEYFEEDDEEESLEMQTEE